LSHKAEIQKDSAVMAMHAISTQPLKYTVRKSNTNVKQVWFAYNSSVVKSLQGIKNMTTYRSTFILPKTSKNNLTLWELTYDIFVLRFWP